MGYTKKTYETIDNIVKGVCMDLGEGEERYEQYLHWALEAHKDWHLDQAKEIKTVQIDLTPYKAAALPDDFVDWTKVGIKCGNTILTFAKDNYMPFPEDNDGDNVVDVDEDCPRFDVGDYSVVDANGYSLNSFSHYYYNTLNDKGQDTGNLFGLTAKDNYQGYFRLNKEREEIQFRSRILNLETIYLEYISNGYNPCGMSYVHPYAAKLINLYVHWMRKKHNRLSARWQIDDAKTDYWQEHDRVSGRMFDLTAEDILEAWRSAYSLLPLN
jgi:hypothetical protein